MNTLSKLIWMAGRIPGLSHALRSLAGIYADGSVTTIPSGMAAGFKWRRFHRYVNGYWLGHYELAIQKALNSHLAQRDVFYDVGANAGFFTLVAARKVGPTGRCIAFDPLPENIASINDQIELNALHYCEALQAALCDKEGEATFAFDVEGSSMGHLGTSLGHEKQIRVKTTTLDAVAVSYGAPSFIKVDVEGAEGAVLKGATKLLKTTRPKWLIELHGPDCERDVHRILRDANYSFFTLSGNPIVTDATLPHHFVATPNKY